jgi:hypothetical protein
LIWSASGTTRVSPTRESLRFAMGTVGDVDGAGKGATVGAVGLGIRAMSDASVEGVGRGAGCGPRTPTARMPVPRATTAAIFRYGIRNRAQPSIGVFGSSKACLSTWRCWNPVTRIAPGSLLDPAVCPAARQVRQLRPLSTRAISVARGPLVSLRPSPAVSVPAQRLPKNARPPPATRASARRRWRPGSLLRPPSRPGGSDGRPRPRR